MKRQNSLILHNLNNKDLFNLFGIVLDGKISRNEVKKKAIQYCEEHKTDKAVIMTVAGAAKGAFGNIEEPHYGADRFRSVEDMA